MNRVLLILLATLVGSCGLFFLYLRRATNTRRRRFLEQLAAQAKAGSVADRRVLGLAEPLPSFVMELAGHRAVVFASKGYKGGALFGVEFPARGPLPLVILRPERRWDRIGRRLFLNREVQTGDPLFDDALYIESDEEEAVVKALLSHATFRNELRQLFARYGVSHLTLSRGGVAAQIVSTTNVGPGHLQALQNLAQKLAPVVDAAPNLDDPGRGVRTAARGDAMVVWAWGGFVATHVLNVLTQALHNGRWEPFLSKDESSSRGVGLVAYAGLLLFSFFWARGHSRSLRNFAQIAIAGIFVCLIGVTQVSWILNAKLDTSQETRHAVVISDKQTVRGRYETDYLLIFPALFGVQGTGFQDVSVPIYNAARTGDRFVLGLREGAFHWKWVSSTTLPEHPDLK